MCKVKCLFWCPKFKWEAFKATAAIVVKFWLLTVKFFSRQNAILCSLTELFAPEESRIPSRLSLLSIKGKMQLQHGVDYCRCCHTSAHKNEDNERSENPCSSSCLRSNSNQYCLSPVVPGVQRERDDLVLHLPLVGLQLRERPPQGRQLAVLLLQSVHHRLLGLKQRWRHDVKKISDASAL